MGYLKMKNILNVIFLAVLAISFLSCGRKTEIKTVKKSEIRNQIGGSVTVVIYPDMNILDLVPTDLNAYYIVASDYREEKAFNKLSLSTGIPQNDELDRHICKTSSTKKEELLYKNIKTCMELFKKELASKGKTIEYIISNDTDEDVYLAGLMRTEYDVKVGLNKLEAELFSKKDIMKKYLIEHDKSIKTARFFSINSLDFFKKLTNIADLRKFIQEQNISDWEKVVIKPTGGAGSKGVVIFENDKDIFNNLHQYLTEAGEEDRNYIVEEYISGEILRIDGFVNKEGQILINYTSKYTITPKRFYQKGDAQLTLNKADLSKRKFYQDFSQKVVNAFNFRKGVYHLEAIDKNGELYFLEVGARPGGTLSTTFKTIGYPVEKAFVYYQVGRDVEIKDNNKTFASVAMELPRLKVSEAEPEIDNFWLDSFKYKDLDTLKYYITEISWADEAKNYVETSRRIMQVIFIADRSEYSDLEKEAKSFYESISADVRIKGGPVPRLSDKWVSYINETWQTKTVEMEKDKK